MIFFFQEVVVLILMKSNSSVFSVMTSALGVIPKKLLPNPRSLKFSMFSSRIFTVFYKKNSRVRGTWWATVHGVAESWK